MSQSWRERWYQSHPDYTAVNKQLHVIISHLCLSHNDTILPNSHSTLNISPILGQKIALGIYKHIPQPHWPHVPMTLKYKTEKINVQTIKIVPTANDLEYTLENQFVSKV